MVRARGFSAGLRGQIDLDAHLALPFTYHKSLPLSESHVAALKCDCPSTYPVGL